MRIVYFLLLAPMTLAAQVKIQVSVGVEYQKNFPGQSNLYVEYDKGGTQTANVRPVHSFSPLGVIHFAWTPWETETRSTGFTVSLMPEQSISQRWDVTYDYPSPGNATRFQSLIESYLGFGIQTLWRGTIDCGVGLELRHENFEYSLANPGLNIGLNGSSSQLRPWIHGIAQHTFQPSRSGASAWFIALQASVGIGHKSATGNLSEESGSDLIDANGFAPQGSLEFQVGVAF